MDMSNVQFMWSSDEISKHSSDYWMRVIDIASKNSVTRITRYALDICIRTFHPCL